MAGPSRAFFGCLYYAAFFGCLYYAALPPAEAVALRETDCVLPARGWGRIDLAASPAPEPSGPTTAAAGDREGRGAAGSRS